MSFTETTLGLRRKGTEKLFSWEWNAVLDGLDILYGNFKDVAAKGSAEKPFWELYGYYGYFFYDLQVQGKKVIKDGDPVNINDIFEPAKEKITQAINDSKISSIADYTANLPAMRSAEEASRDLLTEIRDKVVKLRMDEYGNVGVIIAEPLDEYGFVKTSSQRALESVFTPVSNSDSVSASENAYGLTVSLYTGGRPNINVYYKLGGAGEIYIEGSTDGVTWRPIDSVSLSAAGEGTKILTGVAFPYVRARVPTTGIDIELEIVASR